MHPPRARAPLLGSLLLAAALAVQAAPRAAHACTLWAAAGEAVEGGGVLVAKNRDFRPDHRQEIEILRPREGWAALVLRAVGGAEPGIKAGINERGLVIVSATAGEVPADERRRAGGGSGLMGRLLSSCGGIDEVLRETGHFRRPVFYLLGDRAGVAAIEVAPDGSLAVERLASGTLYHANHYRWLAREGLPRPPGASSRAREARIAGLLATEAGPFTAEDFLRWSRDRSDGPDRSLWRTGRNPQAVRTLATWIARIPPGGDPEVTVRIADPGEPERFCRIDAGLLLRRTAGTSPPPGKPLCPPCPDDGDPRGAGLRGDRRIPPGRNGLPAPSPAFRQTERTSP
ncbi:MAG: carcinine hydrolase/isopenicillin-N N-acyltransferase family protein [Desulfobacterales bacterium]